MKKMILILCMAFFSSLAGLCPVEVRQPITIVQAEPLQPYEALWRAVCMVESGGDRWAYNKREHAVGIAQVRMIRLRDYNRRAGKSYQLSDMYDPYKAKIVFMYYCSGDYERIAKSWNGSGKKTIKYWNNIKKQLKYLDISKL